MNGSEHYREAERLLAGIAKARKKLKKSGDRLVAPHVAQSIRDAFKMDIDLASVHATLALAAAMSERESKDPRS